MISDQELEELKQSDGLLQKLFNVLEHHENTTRPREESVRVIIRILRSYYTGYKHGPVPLCIADRIRVRTTRDIIHYLESLAKKPPFAYIEACKYFSHKITEQMERML